MPEKIVFILSTSRTGTKTLAEGLQGENILSPHQPPYSRILTIASNYYLHGWISRSLLERLVILLRKPQILNADCQYYIQVFSLDYLPAKIISEKFQNVYILHIVRDPRTFVRSYINWMHTRYKSFVANKLILGWQPSGYFTKELSWQVWQNFDEFQRVCWQWTYKNTMLETLFSDYKDYLRVRFEDLFLSQNLDTLKGVLSFAGIPYLYKHGIMINKRENTSKKTYLSKWEFWVPERKQQLFDICGDKMKEYGYR